MITSSAGSYVKIAFRKFYRDKLYSLINISGLSLAIACCLILALYLRGELNYDQHHLNHDRIYRIVNEHTAGDTVSAVASTPDVLAPMFAEEFSEIENYLTIQPDRSSLYRHEQDTFYWEVYTTDERVFDVFTFDVIYGDAETALLDGTSIAVSETFAKRYFGNVNPVGETITDNTDEPITITLVFADLPENSHLKYDALRSSHGPRRAIPEGLTERRERLWFVNSYSYFLMHEGFDTANFDAMADDFYDRHMAEQGRNSDTNVRFWLEPLAGIHYKSDLVFDRPQGNSAYLFALIAVGFFVLLIACINYINLATARSLSQAKEVGIRKVLGANTRALRWQFIAEAVLVVFVSTLVGVILVETALTFSPVHELLGKTLEFSISEEPQIFMWLALFSLTIGLLTGIYPAVYLSSWAPISGLVGNTGGSKANIGLRKALVLAQFSVSVAVVASTLLMVDQIRYLSNKSLGFEIDSRISIRMTGADLLRKFPTIKTELLQYPDVLGVTSNFVRMGQSMPLWAFSIEQDDGAMATTLVEFNEVETDYLDVMEMEIQQGRGFSEGPSIDNNFGYIVNETLVEQMGWQDAIGKRVTTIPGEEGFFPDSRVIGVVKDFNFNSLHTAIGPLALLQYRRALQDTPSTGRNGGDFIIRYMTLNLATENIEETLNHLEDRFAEFDPKHPFEFEFLDDRFRRLYDSEQNLMKLIGGFAGLCIFIACLGLFGLASFTTEQRSKEIGIRKTLGASTSQIILMLSRNMLVLVLLGSLVGCTLAFFGFSAWLENFAYRADANLTAYIIATLATLLVAFATVAVQSYRTARADPVEILRYE